MIGLISKKSTKLDPSKIIFFDGFYLFTFDERKLILLLKFYKFENKEQIKFKIYNLVDHRNVISIALK